MNLAQIKAVGNIHEIVPNLFLGNMWSTDPNVLNQHGIQVVLNVSSAETDVNKGRYKLDSHLILKIDDNPRASETMLKEIIPKAMRYIDTYLHPSAPSKKRILVHCVAGVSRSATVVAAWLMKTYGMDRDKVLKLMKSRRSIVNPNHGFMRVLTDWGKYLKRFHAKSATDSRRIVTTGRGYEYPQTNHHVSPNPVPERINSSHLHHMSSDQIDNYGNMQNRQFERRFSVIPSDAKTLVTPQQGPSYYREFEEKIHSNDDHFKHMY